MSDRYLVRIRDGGTITEHFKVYATAGVGVVETNTIVTLAIEEHNDDTTDVHGITDTADLETQAGAQNKVDTLAATVADDIADLTAATTAALTAHTSDSTGVHGIADTSLLETTAGAASKVSVHNLDTTGVHGITDTADLATSSDIADAVSNWTTELAAAIAAHNADSTGVHGIDDTAELDPDLYAKLLVEGGPVQFVDGDGNPLLTLYPAGDLIIGPTDGIDLTNTSKSHPHVGYWAVSANEDFPKFNARTINLVENNDPAEVVFRRSAGDPANRELAKTVLALGIADVTVLDGDDDVVCADLGTDDAWPAGGGTFFVQPILGDDVAVFTYETRDLDTNTLEGVTYVRHAGATSYSAGAYVSRPVGAGASIGSISGQADMGRGDFQPKSMRYGLLTGGEQMPDGYGRYYAAGAMQWSTNAPGPWSQSITREYLDEHGRHILLGCYLQGAETTPRRRMSVAMHAAHANGPTEIPAPGTWPYEIAVDSPHDYPDEGTLIVVTTDGVDDFEEEITYTGWEDLAGVWYFTGCEGGTEGNTIPGGRTLNLHKDEIGPVLGTKGDIVAQDYGNDRQAVLGAVGPDFEPGVRFGDNDRVELYLIANNLLGIRPGARIRGHDDTGSTVVFEARNVSHTTNTWEVRAGGITGYGDGTAIGALLKYISTGLLAVRNAADNADADLRVGISRVTNYVRLDEIADPGVAAANGVRLFAQDVAGQTVLRVRYPSGSAQTLSSEAGEIYQPLDSDLTAIAALTTTSYGRAFLELANQAALVALLPSYQPLDGDLTSIAALTTTSYGRAFLELANQAALVALLPSYQPLDSDLTSIAALTTTSFGRALLELADAAALRSTAGLSRVGNQHGFVWTGNPLMLSSAAPVGASNRGYYIRLLGSKTGVTTMDLMINAQSGNICVAIYPSNGSAGLAARPSGSRKATTGSIACPAVGYQTVTFTTFASGSSVDIDDGDWVHISADNNTVNFGRISGAITPNAAGGGVSYYEESSFPAPASVGSLVAGLQPLWASTS